MNSYLVDKNNKKKAVIVPIDEYNTLVKELKKYKKITESLEDELDIKLANKAIKERERVDFILKNYV